MNKYIQLCVFFPLFWGTLFATAPPVPSSGVIERQLEKEYETEPLKPDRKIPQIEIDIPEERLSMPEGLKVYIREIRLKNNEALSSTAILKQIENRLHCSLSLCDIYDICHSIENFYAEKGFFLARAFPPPQTITDGVITIEIVEGKLGQVTIEGNKHYKEKFILRYFTPLQNKAVNYHQLLRTLLLLNENSDLQAGAIFIKGKELGTVDLTIQVQDKTPTHLYINGNNYGRWLTPNIRIGARLDSRLFTDGDKFSVTQTIGIPASALYFTDLIYRFPVNVKGTFCELAYLTSTFHIQEMKDLKLRGSSHIATIKASHALTRRQFLNCDLYASFDYKQIKNLTLHQLTSFDKLRVLTLGSIFDHYNPLIGRNYIVLKMGIGLPGFLDGLDNPTASSSRPGAQGNFFKLNLDYDYLKTLPHSMFLSLHASGQWSPNKLTVPEQIYIGGADTVRGFPLATGMGDSGYYCNAEWRFAPPGMGNKKIKDILQFSLFMDQGSVFFKDNGNTYQWSTGFGVRINGPWGLAGTFEVGFPLNHRDLSRDAFFYIKITDRAF
ncbi:MAG: ShlB/FhaC/HecB family hemolysin secretion/activation protein [Parachlamydiales bacterium]|nr:ShlB/FhaC/HecB family hemolysin secretion/activation protein [Parachlamydiales bacterium]